MVKDESIVNLDFANNEMCINFIKYKQNKDTKKWATRNTKLLEIIHTNICRPFDVLYF